MPYSTLLLENRDGIALVTINRPDKLNALNHAVIGELGELASQIHSDPSVRAVMLTGAGPKAFVAGADIGELAACGPAEAERLSKEGSRVFRMLEQSTKPVLAAANGFAARGQAWAATGRFRRGARPQAHGGRARGRRARPGGGRACGGAPPPAGPAGAATRRRRGEQTPPAKTRPRHPT